MKSETNKISVAEIDSPVGVLRLTALDQALQRLDFTHQNQAANQTATPIGVLKETVSQLHAYFSGKLEQFDLPLAPQGTPFQLEVWLRLGEIPYGETISYGELARRIGNPNASRAVGLANGSNPISIIIPCHRVIGSNGKLTGYGGGLPIKEKLLALERRQLRLL